MKKVYFARMGAPFKADEAQTIGEFMEKHGQTPEKFVEASKDPNSPTHHLFEWDVKKAAKKHWLAQARNIINHVSVKIYTQPNTYMTFDRAVHSVIVGGEREYVSMEQVLSNKDLRKQALLMAWSSLEGWMARYEQYKEFSAIKEAVEKTRQKLTEANII